MSSHVYDIDALMQEDSDEASWTSARTSRHLRYYRKDARSKASHSGVRSTLLTKPICALDGEGKTRLNKRHDYCLICAVWPTGRRCIQGHALTTEQCLDFVMDLPDDHVYLGYGLSYDTNMWLLGLPNGYIDKLLDEGKWRFRQYEIEWVERKYITIRAYGKVRTVYDVLAFSFTSSDMTTPK